MKCNLKIWIGLLWVVLSSMVSAAEISALKCLEISSLPQNKIEILLEFSEPAIIPKSFSIKAPPVIVFDFPFVKNKLPKEVLRKKNAEGILKGVNVIETESKTRIVLDIQRMVAFETKAEGNILKIILEGGGGKSPIKLRKVKAHDDYRIKSFDFHRGEEGAARIIVDLSASDIGIDFKEENGKMVAQFANATIEERLMKRYNVMDFGTPVKNIDIVKKGNDVDLIIQTTGDYEKIAYQMDKQFIIEIKSKNEAEKEAIKEAAGQYVGEKISLNFQDIDLRAVLQIIADFSGFNIIVGDGVKGNITLRLQDVPWDQALDIILKSAGLDKRQYGSVMLVGSASEIAAREKIELEGQKQMQDLGPMKSELIAIKYASAEDLATLLKDKANSLMTSRGTVSVDKRTNTLLIQDVVNKLNEVKNLIKKLDVPVRQVEISTQIVTADHTLESALGIKFGGGANAGFGHRRLGVGGSMSRARAIADFTNSNGQPGVPPSNVDFTGSDPVNANITQEEYNGTAPTVNNTEGLFSDLPVPSSGTVFGAAGLTAAKAGLALARLPNGTLLDLELQALEYENKTKTLARPKLITMDQNKATVEKGVDIPYQEASSSGATSVAYKTAALKLEVTPHITPDDKISLDLQISQDSQGASTTAGPTINTNRLQTKVLVSNGETVVLGGVLQLEDNKRWAKVPFFGDLPIIGGLFRNKYANNNPRELIIFLTPKILDTLVTKES